MKRILSALIVLALAVSLAGCSVQDYQTAGTLYKEGKYAQALEIYEALADYADSAKMAEICRQKANYEKAGQLLTAGEYEQAAQMFDELGLYSDSPLMAAESRYIGGKASLEAEDYERAIALLTTLGGYKDSMDLVNLARWRWLGQQRYTVILEAEGTDYAAVSLEPVEDQVMRIVLKKRSQILNLPYEMDFVMTLVRTQPDAAYNLTYTSTNVKTITETAEGNVTLRAFGEGFPVTTFSQTITDAEGNVTESDQTKDALMMKAVMAEVIADVTENLPLLIEKSGADVTLADLGF